MPCAMTYCKRGLRWFRWLITAAFFSTVIIDSALAQAITRPPVSRPRTTPELRRGVNFGNMLEAPSEGAWGLTVQSSYFDKVVEAGFDHIRLPVSWTHHTANTSPYDIDPEFMSRVKWVVDQAETRGLKIIVNNHHYDEIHANPNQEKPRALAMWSQIATVFRNRSPKVFFEILNEPHGQFNQNPELWNAFMAEALAVIRRTNPTRPVLVGPVSWNSIRALDSFEPPKDEHLVATVHFYEPFEFTHQGAEWVTPSPPLGATWTGSRHQLGPDWQNWSWGTTVNPLDDGMQITFDQGWAGFQVNTDQPVLASQLVLNVDRQMNLRVRISNGPSETLTPLQTSEGSQDYVIAVDPGVQPVQRIFIQNMTPEAVPAFKIRKMELTGALESHSIVTTQAGAMRDALEAVSNWARPRNMRVYLGEFGAYYKADMNSRVAWTSAVRQEAERLGFSYGYWEFASGFGIYDPINHVWRLPLLQSLMPNF